MGERAALRDVLYRVLAIVYRHAERVEVIEYPRSIGRRSIDLAVRLRDGRSMLVKVAQDLRRLPRGEVQELASVASSLGTPALVAAEYYQGRPLERGVLYERMGVPALNPETLEDVLEEGGVYLYHSKDTLKAKVNPEVLRSLRSEMGLSLGNVASYLGVSRRTVYEYERGSMDPTVEKAEKLVELFGIEVLKKIDPLSRPPEFKPPAEEPPEDTPERMAFEALSRAGYKVAYAKRTAPDITASDPQGSAKVTVIVHRSGESLHKLEDRALYTARIAQTTGASPVALVDTGRAEAVAEKAGLLVARRPEDIVDERG